MNEHPAVVLIHGFGGGERDYKGVKKFLADRQLSIEFHSFYYKNRFGTVTLTELADEFAAFIQSNLSGKKFVIIGFSQGGLIFRDFAMRYPELARNVDRAITVCTPHHGSLLAYCAFGKGVADLRPSSNFLKRLTRYDDGIAYYAAYNPIDFIVVPGTSARFEKAKLNKRVFAPTHFLTFKSKNTLTFIESVLFPTE